METLYIIGNGFDKNHGMKTSYKDFMDFVKERYHHDYKSMVRFFNKEESDNWCNFEEDLEQLFRYDFDKVLIQSAGEDPLKYLDAKFGWISRLNKYLLDWVEELERTLPKVKKFQFNSPYQFFTFNYTMLLERLYDIPEDKVNHIHGKYNPTKDFDYSNDSNIDLQLGFSENAFRKKYPQFAKEDVEWNEIEPEIAHYLPIQPNIKIDDEPEERISKILEFIEDLRFHIKPIDLNLSNNDNFESYKNVKRVIVIGSSLGPHDFEYFSIIRKVVSNCCSWIFAYYNDEDLEDKKKRAKQLRHTIRKFQPISKFYNTETLNNNLCP